MSVTTLAGNTHRSESSTCLNKYVKTLPAPSQAMQRPTCVNLRIRSIDDALKIFTAVRQGLLPMISRRLTADERRALCSGCIYVWEERTQDSTGVYGIERFTEGRKWSNSRAQDVRPPSILLIASPNLAIEGILIL